METVKGNLMICTPEQIGFNYSISGLGSRSLAFMLDYTIRVILILFIVVLFYLLSRIFPSVISLEAVGDISKTWLIAIGFLLYAVIYLGYFIIFEALWAGQTPGKRSIHLRVVRIDGQPIGWMESAIRNILRSIDVLLGFYPIGLIVMFLSPESKRIGDYAAGTVVIFERRVNVPANRSRLRGPARPYRPDIELNISLVTARAYQVAKSFLQRREHMDKTDRDEIAKSLATHLMEKLDISIEKVHHEQFVEEVVSVYEHRKRAI